MADEKWWESSPLADKKKADGEKWWESSPLANPKKEPVRKDRTWGEAASDTGVQLAEGVNNLLGAVPNLVAPDSGVAGFFRDNSDSWRGKQSDVMKAKVEQANAKIAEVDQDSIIDQVIAAGREYSSDPALIARFVTTNLPSMIPGVGAAKIAQAAKLASGAGAAAAATAGTTAAGATNAVLNAGGARGEAYEDIRDTLIKQGVSPDEAEAQALRSSYLPAAVGGAAGFASGKMGLEKALVGKGLSAGGVRAGAASMAGEMVGEQLEEVAPKLATNYQASEFDNRPMSRDVGRTIAETAIASGPMSGASGVIAGMNHKADQTPAPTAQEASAAQAENAQAAGPTPVSAQAAQVEQAAQANPEHFPDGSPQTMAAEAVEQRLAELEIEASTSGLSPLQEAEREALAERASSNRAAEIEAETIGESVETAPASEPKSEASTAAAASPEAGSMSGADAVAAPMDASADAGQTPDFSTGKMPTWPQFVLAHGAKVSELKTGTPAWAGLKASFDQLKISRAGQNQTGNGSTGQATPEIQNRDRARPASVIQMQGMAANPDYMRLGVSRSPETGAPMVFAVGDQAPAVVASGRGDTAVMSDGQRVPFQYAVVEAGDVQPSNFADGSVNPLFDAAHPGTLKSLNNGRTAGLRAAYERGTAENYKQELLADSDMHGIDPVVIDGMRAPMLVRVYAEGDNRANMGAKSQSQALGLSASEQAATDAAVVDDSVVSAFETGELDGAGNRDFARAFIGKLQASGQDVAGMMDAGGALSQAGKIRLQAALVHKAYGDGDLVETLFTSTDNDIRAIGESLKDVAGEWANLRLAAESGAINAQVDVTGNLLQAISMVQKARRAKASLYDAINQVDIETGDVADPLTVGMLRLLYTGHYLTRATGRERLTESLRDYMAAALATSADGDMFGEQIGPADILNALSGSPAPTTNDTATKQPSPSEPTQGERVADGGDPAGSRADEAGQPEPGQEPGGARPSATETGRRSERQDAQDQDQQPAGQGDQGAGEDSSGAVTPELELSSYSPEEVAARQKAAEDAGKAEADRKKSAADKAQADAERGEFALTGSDRVADVGAAGGQAPMFSRASAIGQTDTPAFKKWFGDSKVVDADGKPMVVYHGTAKDFDAFDNSKTGANDMGLWGRGHYFASAPTSANSYALRQGDGARVIPAYVSIQTPLVLRTGSDLVTRLPDGTNTRELIGQNLDGAKIKVIALEGGHDGVIQIKPDGSIGDVVAFHPEQIKSATGNNGEFNPSNPDIRFSRSPDTKAQYEERIDALFKGGKAGLAGVKVLDRSDVLGLLDFGGKPLLLAEGKVIAGQANHPRMTAAVWKKVPEWIENPAAVFESETDGGLVFIAPEALGGAPVSIIVRPDVGKPNTLEAHLLLNAYDRSTTTPFQRWINEGLLKYADTKKFPALLESTSGRRLPGTALNNKPGTNKILTEKNLSGYRKANPPAEPAMSRGESHDGNPASARVQSIVDAIKKTWANGPEVIVVNDMQDEAVPQRVRDYDQAQRSEGAEGEPEGFFYGGKVYLVASQLSGTKDVIRVLFHEALGHFGLRGVFGEALTPILNQIVTVRAKDVKAKAEAYGIDLSTKAGKLEAAEEVLAEMAQSHPELGYVQRAVAAIRTWLRKNVPGFAAMRLSDDEIIASYLLPARDFVARGKKAEASGADALPAYSRGNHAGQPQGPQLQSNLAKLQSKVNGLLSAERKDWMIYNIQDKFIDLKRIQDQIKALGGTVSELNDAYLGEELYHKRVAKRTENFLRDEVRPLLQGLAKAKVTVEEFEGYLHARHAPEANAKMAERNPNQAELDAKRAKADKDVKDLRAAMQSAQAKGMSTAAIQKALGNAIAEQDKWQGAKPFAGTEDQRLSLSGMSDAESVRVLASFAGDKLQAIQDAATRVDKITNGTLKTLEQYGLMDTASIKAWRDEYKFYIPLHRDEAHADSKAHPIGQGFSTKGDAAKQRVGSNEKVTNILSHVLMQRESALTRGEKNNVVKRLYLLAKQNPDDNLWSFDLPKKKSVDPDTGLVRSMPDIQAINRDNVVNLRIGGKDQYMIFNERNDQALRLAYAMKNLDAAELGFIGRNMGKVTRFMAAMNTQYNPVFSVMNYMRDTQGVVLQLSSTKLAGKQKDVLKQMGPRNWYALMADLRDQRKSPHATKTEWLKLFEQFQMDGGATGFRDLYADPADRAKALDKELRKAGGDRAKALKVSDFVLENLSDFNESLENITRLATYKVALDNGLSRQEAASIAKNITVNFNRKGVQTSKLGAHYAFLNAAVQGNTRLLQTMTGPAGRKIAMGGVALGAMSALMGQYMMGGGDGADDEWKKIPEFVKERSIIIPLGRKDYVAIPMPLGYHVLPNTGRKLVDMLMNNDPAKSRASYAGDIAMTALNAFNPMGGAENIAQMLAFTWLDPYVALATNKDWTGNGIYKENMNGLDPKPGHTRAKESTAGPYRWISEQLNALSGGNEWKPGAVSPPPEAISYLVDQFLGGVGREANKLGAMATSVYTGEELPAKDIVFFGRLYGNTKGVTNQSPAYYNNVKEINAAEAEAKGRIKLGENPDAVLQDVPLARASSAATAIEKNVRALTKMRREIQKSDQANKREMVKEINLQIEQQMHGLNQHVHQVLTQAKAS